MVTQQEREDRQLTSLQKNLGHRRTRTLNKIHRIVSNGKQTVELYNLVTDPMEAKDLSKSDADRTATMLEQLDKWQNSVFDSWEGKDYQKP